MNIYNISDISKYPCRFYDENMKNEEDILDEVTYVTLDVGTLAIVVLVILPVCSLLTFSIMWCWYRLSSPSRLQCERCRLQLGFSGSQYPQHLTVQIFCFFETETFRDCKFSNLSRPRLSRDCNIGFFETETFQDLEKVIETETFS